MLALIVVVLPWLYLAEQPECQRALVRDTYECRHKEYAEVRAPAAAAPASAVPHE